MFPAEGQEVLVNIYRKRLPGKGEDKIYFDLFSEQQKEFTAKYYAFASAVIAMDLPEATAIESVLAAIPTTRL